MNYTGKILVLCLCALYIVVCFIKGCNNVRYLEKVCTEEILAKVEILKTKHFFFCKYYIANFTYTFDNTTYTVRKGLFKTIDSDELVIYINPENPQECEILRLYDRLKCK